MSAPRPITGARPAEDIQKHLTACCGLCRRPSPSTHGHKDCLSRHYAEMDAKRVDKKEGEAAVMIRTQQP